LSAIEIATSNLVLVEKKKKRHWRFFWRQTLL